jgi:three-Cys-motif partner protein
MIERVFGAGHTQDKLHRVRGYLSAYSAALKNQKFLLSYIDVFAGSGDRTVRVAALSDA